jgi:hypothetical protein
MNIEERPKSNNTWVMRLMAFLLFETGAKQNSLRRLKLSNPKLASWLASHARRLATGAGRLKSSAYLAYEGISMLEGLRKYETVPMLRSQDIMINVSLLVN